MVFDLPITVRAEDADHLGHVNNVVWLRWVQEAAAAHWSVLAPPDVQDSVAWVVRRHELDYLRSAYPGDALVARTWVEETSGATSVRMVLILDAEGRELLRARTTWIAWDRRANRPMRIGADLLRLLETGRGGAAQSPLG